uniref:Glycosyltransferase n=1 Tax=Andrographis paniculata TaxID=175694 RepID=A0A3S7QI85_ANDPA|nr:UDP-glycosyltransferase [Andrographis paniculata]
METIVLYPSPGMGHVIAMVELAKFILRRRPSTAIAVLIAPPSFNTGSTAAYIRRISATVPSITFHHLPQVTVHDFSSFPSMESVIFHVLRRSNDAVRRTLEQISASAAVSAFIIDFFCPSLAIAKELRIPTYYFITSGACILAFFLCLPEIDETTTESFRDMNTSLNVPGIPAIVPAKDMILPLLDRDSSDYDDFVKFSFDLVKSDGIIVNTFENLETKALRSIREGKCNPGGRTPPVYCVGPLLDSDGHHGGDNECLRWLDGQPERSVVFLCFGSLGLHSAEQLREIAGGLERSGERFLWVVRSPPTADPRKRFEPPPPELERLLPAGFLERTKDRGFVVESWAPQVAVLNHGAVGGFVTHCGWNSVLEAVCAGVPMVAWPIYAEQKMNRVVMVEDMKLAVSMEAAADGFVAAAEVERRVKEVMEAESEVRKVVEVMCQEAKAAVSDGGSSIAALEKLLDLWTSRGK